jgi:hypothetical protein
VNLFNNLSGIYTHCEVIFAEEYKNGDGEANPILATPVCTRVCTHVYVCNLSTSSNPIAVTGLCTVEGEMQLD